MTYSAASRSVLSTDEIHVWIARLANDHRTAAYFLAILSEQERTRAERFSYESDRLRFIQAHGIVRQILADYAGKNAAALSFRANRFGKPFLVRDANTPNIQFSVSHSGNCCVLALRLDHSIGIDVEKLRDLPNLKRMSYRYFTQSEADTLGALQGTQQRNAFFSLWTHKEAMVKGLGISLAANLRQIEFDFDPTRGLRLVSWGSNTSIAQEWSLRSLSPAPEYIAAVVCQHPVRSLTIKKWPCDAAAL